MKIAAFGFRDKYDLFEIPGAELKEISNGENKTHLGFANNNELQYPLLFDIDYTLRRKFGVQKTIGFLVGKGNYKINYHGIIIHIFEYLFN